VFPVPFPVRNDFRSPEFVVGFWQPSLPASVAVPEAPVDEYDLLSETEDDIGFSRQIPSMKPKTIAHFVDHAAHD